MSTTERKTAKKFTVHERGENGAARCGARTRYGIGSCGSSGRKVGVYFAAEGETVNCERCVCAREKAGKRAEKRAVGKAEVDAARAAGTAAGAAWRNDSGGLSLDVAPEKARKAAGYKFKLGYEFEDAFINAAVGRVRA